MISDPRFHRFWEWRSALLMALSMPITLAMTAGMAHMVMEESISKAAGANFGEPKSFRATYCSGPPT